MLYLSLTFVVALIFVVLLIILLSPASTPDFRLKAPCGKRELESAVVDLALKCRFSRKGGTGLPLRVVTRKITEAYAVIDKKKASGFSLTEFERVFYNNYAQISSSLADVKNSYRKFYELPHVWGLPRIYFLCELIVKLNGGYVTQDAFSDCVKLFSESCPLEWNEIICLRDALSYAVAEYVTIFASAAVKINSFSEKGRSDAERERVNVELLKSTSYLYALYEQGGDKLKNELKKLCFDNGIDVKERIDKLYDSFNKYNVCVSAAVKTLSERKKWMGEEYILSLSPVNSFFNSCKELRFWENTLSTRRLYLESVSRISLKTGKSELAVATEAAARAASDNCDVGEFLLKKERRKASESAVVLLRVFIAAALCTAIYFIVPFPRIATVILALPLSVVCSCLIVSAVFKAAITPQNLPYKDIKYIPEENGANIVLKADINCKQDVKDAVFGLECLAYANPDAHFSYTLYAVVSPDGKDKESVFALIRSVEKAFAELDGDRYNLLIQKLQSSGEKEEEDFEKSLSYSADKLSGLILRGDDSPFCKVFGNTYKKKYVVIAGEDVIFNCGQELLEIMEHPFNYKKNFVSAKKICTPQNADISLFARLFSFKSKSNDFTGGEEFYNPFESIDGNPIGIIRVKEFDSALSDYKERGFKSDKAFIAAINTDSAVCGEKVYAPFPIDLIGFSVLNFLRLKTDLLLCKSRKKNKNPNSKARIPFSRQQNAFCRIIYALSPLFSSGLIISSLFSPYSSVIVAVALLPYLVGFLLTIPEFSKSAADAFKGLAVIFIKICVLPVTAAYNVKAFVSAFFSGSRTNKGRHKAESAGDGETNESVVMILMTAAVAIFAVNIFYGKYIAPFVMCALFVSAVPLMSLLSEKKRPMRKITPALNGYLSLTAAKTWNYFAESCIKENNFLPPDSYCEVGDKGFSKTTSPASVGMALVAAFSAKELKIIDSAKAAAFIAPLINSLYGLERYRGNFYSSYDLKTKRALPPYYVSAAENGCIFCALILAKSFADDKTETAIDDIIKKFDFKALYDERSGLFYKGESVGEKQFDGTVDFFASEELLYCLSGIGAGKIPRSAFDNLSKEGVRYNRKTLYSSTGGAIEYLLAPLFFDYAKGTFCNAAAVGAVSAQIKYASVNNLPYWGLSECLCLGLNEKDEYRSGFFGVKNIAFYENDGDKTISPYSCLLALKYAPREAEANIAALTENKILGRYGFYDALEREGVVRTFTAFRQGLSMGAICNFMSQNSLVNAMRSVPCVRAAEILLYAPNRFGKTRKKFDAAKAEVTAPKPRKADGFFMYPTVGLYGTNNYKFILDEFGKGFSVSGNYYLTQKRQDAGFNVYASACGETFDLTVGSNASFYFDHAEYVTSASFFKACVNARALVGEPGEVRKVTIKNTSNAEIKVAVGAFAEIKLDKNYFCTEDEGLKEILVKTVICDGYAYALRDKTAPCLAHYACGAENIKYYTSRKEFIDIFKPTAKTGLKDPVLGSSADIRLSAGEEKTVVFVLFVSALESSIEKRFDVISSDGFFERDEAFGGLDNAVDNETARIASRLLYGSYGIYEDDSLAGFVNISYPTVIVTVENERELSRAERELIRCATLYSYGIKFNVAVCYRASRVFNSEFLSDINSMVQRAEIKRVVPADCIFRIFNELSNMNVAEKLKAAAQYRDFHNPALKSGFIIAKQQLPNAEINAPELVLKTGKGGFTADGSYFADVSDGPCVKPWRNFVATEGFGTVMTDTGGGYTFSEDAVTGKITSGSETSPPEQPSESVFLGEGATVWTVTRAPITKNCRYFVLHSFGFTEYTCNFNGILARLKEFIGHTGVKYYLTELNNAADFDRKLNLALVLDVALGTSGQSACCLYGYREGNAVIVKNAVNGMFCSVESSARLESWSFSRKSMMNRRLEYVRITDLEEEKGNSLIYSTSVTVAAKSTQKVVFCLSSGAEAHPELTEEVLESVKSKYSSVSSVTLQSGDLSIDMFYKWLPYQVFCAAFFNRFGYDSAGTVNTFRDKLQTAACLMYFDSVAAKKLILDCARCQFEKGDVLNFRDACGAGLRTLRYDDRLFLPIAVADYISFSGDSEILSERIPYLTDMPVPPFNSAVYGKPSKTGRTGSLLEHCKKALFSTETDAKNRVLYKGGDGDLAVAERAAEGISVYGTILYYTAIKKFLPYVTFPDEKEKLNILLVKLSAAVESQWDGEWYRRAVMKDGLVLGGSVSREYKIDLMTQALAAVSGAVSSERADFALRSADRRLVNDKDRIVPSFVPPFEKCGQKFEAGKYPPGVRSNGAQNAESVVMFIEALYKCGRYNRAYEILNMLNPINRSLTEADMKKYKSEPFSLALNVTSSGCAGEGDLSWFALPASKMYRCITEYMLGMTFKGDTLTMRPRLPDKTKEISVRVKRGKCDIQILIDNSVKDGEWRFSVGGVTYNSDTIRLFPSLNGKNITISRKK